MSGWQHEPQRGVHPLLYTTHHRALCYPEGAPNDDVYGVFMTDLGWLPPLSPFGASASPAAVGAGFFFCPPCHQKYTWNTWKCMAYTLPVLPPCSLCTCSPFLTSLSVSLYLLHHIQYSLSPSVSINHSWTAAVD